MVFSLWSELIGPRQPLRGLRAPGRSYAGEASRCLGKTLDERGGRLRSAPRRLLEHPDQERQPSEEQRSDHDQPDIEGGAPDRQLRWGKETDDECEHHANESDPGDRPHACVSAGNAIAALQVRLRIAQTNRGESQISLTDPDSRAMAAHTKVGVGYNIQIAVDAKNKMIVEQAVSNQVVDMGLLKETAEPARKILDVETIDVVADRGYFKSEDIEACEKAGLTPHVPRPQRGSSASRGFFRKDEFRYDSAQDAYICPAGQVLATRYESKLRDLKKTDYANRAACPVCPLRSRCTNDFRKVSRLENEATLERMAERLKARPEILDRRRETVEHPFGSIKQWMNQGAFLMKGLDKVRAEFSLTALAYNLRRAINILGVEAMKAAVVG
jgi:Transposase DDE domain